MPQLHHKPVLDHRYQIEICFPEPDQPETWETITSFPTPREAIRRCSECLEAVKDLLFDRYGKDVDENFVRIRVWDANSHDQVLWEDERGALHASSEFFDQIRDLRVSSRAEAGEPEPA